MSAFLVEQDSISKICLWIASENDSDGTYRQCKDIINELGYNLEDWTEHKNELERLGEDMYKLNCYSLTQRYDDKMSDFDEFKFKWDTKRLSIIQCLKSIQCFTYQSCEGDAEDQPLYKALRKIEGILKGAIVGGIEEYKAAKWE